MRKIMSLSIFIFGVSVLSGCVVGVKHNYQEVTADIVASGSKKVSIATYDRRPEILSKETAPEVTGWQKGGYGNPFKVTTESGRPLADEISVAIVASLEKKGFAASPVSVAFNEEKSTVMDKLKASGADTLLLLTMYEWFSNCYVNTDLDYNLHLQVLDKSGTVLTENQVKGKDDLGGSFWTTVGASKEVTRAAFKRKIEELLNNPEVTKALQR